LLKLFPSLLLLVVLHKVSLLTILLFQYQMCFDLSPTDTLVVVHHMRNLQLHTTMSHSLAVLYHSGLRVLLPMMNLLVQLYPKQHRELVATSYLPE
jgi:hypothetical protein